MEPREIYDVLGILFPDAKAELNYRNHFELLIAVVLSAQTTDVAVNKVTSHLFEKYPSPEKLSKAKTSDVINIINSIGLYKTKSNNIINLSKMLVEKYDGQVPNNYDDLITLPGVGRKTANVVLSEGFDVPRIAVDTHVLRVSNRLGLANSSNVLEVEEALMKQFDQSLWHLLHLRMIFFGRYFCTARPKKCEICPFKDFCLFLKGQAK